MTYIRDYRVQDSLDEKIWFEILVPLLKNKRILQS